MTTPLTPSEREHLTAALLGALPWRQGAAIETAERYDVATQSLLLQIEHNDLQLPKTSTDEQRLTFLDTVIVPRIVEQALRCMSQPGAPVGIESATATGRLSTQMALNSFHSSGQLHTETLTGVPRLNEIFNATKEIKGPMMVVRLLPQPHWQPERVPDAYNTCASSTNIAGFGRFHAFKRWTRFWFEHRTLHDFIDLEGNPPILYRPTTFEGLPSPEPYWYAPWRAVYGPMRAQTMPQSEPGSSWHTVRVKLNRTMLVQYQVSMVYIAQVVQESVLWAKIKKRFGSWTPLLHVIASPDYEATLDLHVRVDHLPPLQRIYSKARIEQSRQGRILLDEKRRRSIFLTQVVLYELSQVRLCGVPGILEINWRTRGDAEALKTKRENPGELRPEQLWEVITRGSCLRAMISRPQVHVPSLFTNDAGQTLEVLGIEAARALYMHEMRACMGSVDEAMLQTAVDIMMHRGTITPANRFGSHPLDGPLTKASNEMSTQTLLRAALTHQRENLNGVSAATMIGQPIKIGTGLPQVSWDEGVWLQQIGERLSSIKEDRTEEAENEQDDKRHVQMVVAPDNQPNQSTSLSNLLSRLSMATGHAYGAADVQEV